MYSDQHEVTVSFNKLKLGLEALIFSYTMAMLTIILFFCLNVQDDRLQKF